MSCSSRLTAGALVVALASLAACDRSRSDPGPGVDVLVAGWEYEGDVQVATVWTNGVAQALGDAVTPSIATALAVTDGGEVLVVGCTAAVGASLWRNGALQALASADSCAEDVAVSGGDVYVVGWESFHPMLWKNGVAEMLPHQANARANALAVTVSGSDVYVAGWALETILLPTMSFTTNVAKLWRNGVGTSLSDGRSPAIARAVAVDGPDVYVAGDVSGAAAGSYGVATLWRNGAAQALGAGPGVATAVAAARGDVRLAGGVSAGAVDAAVVWRDGNVHALTDGRAQAFANALDLADGREYVAGYDQSAPVLWTDGVPARLGESGDALDVVVVPHPERVQPPAPGPFAAAASSRLTPAPAPARAGR